MPNCNSNPSTVNLRGGAITPALLISTSIGPSSPSANAATEDRSARSSALTSSSPGRSATAALPLATSRQAHTTLAPAEASALAVTRPRPLFAPVTTNVRPF